MKIKKDLETVSELARLQQQQIAQERQAGSKGAPSKSSPDSIDSVRVNLGQYLKQELNPELLGQERSARIQQIKALVDSNQYRVDSDELARKFIDVASDEVDDLKAILGG